MTSDDSPIIDFYPDDFEIDMNGKKMQWQGVALLPFIEQDRLLSAIRSKQDQLTDDEKRRNSHGVNVMLIMDENPLYQQFQTLYTKKRPNEVSSESSDRTADADICVRQPVPINGNLSSGVFGTVLPDPTCIPGSTLDTPIPEIEECPDLYDNRAISVQYWFPKQLKPHKSSLLPGVQPPRPILDDYDKDRVRSSGGNNGSRRRGGYGGGGNGFGHNSPGMGTPNSHRSNNNSPYGTPSYSPSQGRGGYSGRGDFGTPSRGGYNNRGGYNGNTSNYNQPGGMGGAAAYNNFAAPPRPAYSAPNYGGGGYPPQGMGGGYQGGLGGSGAYAPPAAAYNPYGAPPNPYGAPSNPYGGGGGFSGNSGSSYSRGGAAGGRGRGAAPGRGGGYGGYGYGTRGGR
jgi:5'-3' exoribonuclease 2